MGGERNSAGEGRASELEGFQIKVYSRGFSRAFMIPLAVAGGITGYFAGEYISDAYFPASGGVSETSTEVPLFLLAAFLVWSLVINLVRYLLMRFFGARPRVGKPSASGNLASGWVRVRAGGHRFGRNEFALISAVPFVVGWTVVPISAAAAITLFSVAGPVIPFFGGVMGILVSFLWYPAISLSNPRGSLVEELEEEAGIVRFYRPV